MVNIRISNILLTYLDGTWATGPGCTMCAKYDWHQISIGNILLTYLGPGTTLDIRINDEGKC